MPCACCAGCCNYTLPNCLHLTVNSTCGCLSGTYPMSYDSVTKCWKSGPLCGTVAELNVCSQHFNATFCCNAGPGCDKFTLKVVCGAAGAQCTPAKITYAIGPPTACACGPPLSVSFTGTSGPAPCPCCHDDNCSFTVTP